MSFTPPVERLARRLFPGQVATRLVAPEPYEHDTFTLEGHELRIIEQPDSPSAIQDTKRYLEDFDRLQKTATSDQELFDQMTALYPDWVANQSWLMFGFPGA